MRRVSFLLRPRWVALHVAVIAATVTMVLLGRWQWHVAHVHHGSVQNYSYAFQWWAFCAFTLFMWGRVMRDARRRRAEQAAEGIAGPADAAGPAADATGRTPAEPARAEPQPVAYRRYVMPRTRPEQPDPELAAYNAYLAELAEQERARDEH